MLQPDVDVRISATYKEINLERSLVDVAVRYCAAEDAPEGAARLFGEELFPVCSPALLDGGPRALRTLQDLEHHALLHMDGAERLLDWGTWLAAQGCADLKPAASLRFDGYEQMIGAALSGQGVAMGIGRLVSGLLQEGRLVAPFCKSVVGERAYYVIRSSQTGTRPHVQAFVDWLIEEAEDRGRCPGPGQPQLPTTSGEVSRRKAASTLSAVMRPVRGLSGSGDVLDGHGQVGGIRLHGDGVRVARHARVGPHLYLRAVRARCRRATAPRPR